MSAPTEYPRPEHIKTGWISLLIDETENSAALATRHNARDEFSALIAERDALRAALAKGGAQ